MARDIYATHIALSCILDEDKLMPTFPCVVAVATFLIMGAIFHLLQEGNILPMFNHCRRFLSGKPRRTARLRNIELVLGLVATAVFSLGPLGLQMMDSRPCLAWLLFTLALGCAIYTFWSAAPLSRLSRLCAVFVIGALFCFYAKWSIYANTELDFLFVHPGVFLVQGTGQWLLIVTGLNTHHSLFNVDMTLQDMVTSHAVANEPDFKKRLAMINGMSAFRHYLEVGPTFPGDKIAWIPIDVNNQEYLVSATYRIGDKAFSETEQIRIVNVGKRFVSASQPQPFDTDWQDSITVKSGAGDVLMHCVDPKFPKDENWIAGPPCYPGAKFAPLPRSLCDRCLGSGFEYSPQN